MGFPSGVGPTANEHQALFAGKGFGDLVAVALRLALLGFRYRRRTDMDKLSVDYRAIGLIQENYEVYTGSEQPPCAS